MTPDPVLREAVAKALPHRRGCPQGAWGAGYYCQCEHVNQVSRVLAALDGLVVPVEEHERLRCDFIGERATDGMVGLDYRCVLPMGHDGMHAWQSALDASLSREREAVRLLRAHHDDSRCAIPLAHCETCAFLASYPQADGFDYTVVLSCGDTFRWNSDGNHVPQVGWYFSCPSHSTILGYGPDDGSADYDRDQQVVEVRQESYPQEADRV